MLYLCSRDVMASRCVRVASRIPFTCLYVVVHYDWVYRAPLYSPYQLSVGVSAGAALRFSA